MLIFVQVCRTIDKKLSVFNLRKGFEEQMKSNEFYKKETCVARKHLNKRASEEEEHLNKKTASEE